MSPNWNKTYTGSWSSVAMFALSELTRVTQVIKPDKPSNVRSGSRHQRCRSCRPCPLMLWLTLAFGFQGECWRLFGSTTRVTRVSLTDMRNTNNPALQAERFVLFVFIVRQEQPVLSGTHWSSFAHRQMSVVLCLRRFPMKIENCHIRHQRPLKVHQRPPR